MVSLDLNFDWSVRFFRQRSLTLFCKLFRQHGLPFVSHCFCAKGAKHCFGQLDSSVKNPLKTKFTWSFSKPSPRRPFPCYAKCLNAHSVEDATANILRLKRTCQSVNTPSAQHLHLLTMSPLQSGLILTQSGRAVTPAVTLLFARSVQVAEITFNVWYRIGDMLEPNPDNESPRRIFTPFIERLIVALVRHCQMEPDQVRNLRAPTCCRWRPGNRRQMARLVYLQCFLALLRKWLVWNLFFFALRHFDHFLLRHFGHWNISVICLTVVLKLTVTVFLSLHFQTFRPKWLNFFDHFKIILVYDRKKKQVWNLSGE